MFVIYDDNYMIYVWNCMGFAMIFTCEFFWSISAHNKLRATSKGGRGPQRDQPQELTICMPKTKSDPQRQLMLEVAPCHQFSCGSCSSSRLAWPKSSWNRKLLGPCDSYILTFYKSNKYSKIVIYRNADLHGKMMRQWRYVWVIYIIYIYANNVLQSVACFIQSERSSMPQKLQFWDILSGIFSVSLYMQYYFHQELLPSSAVSDFSIFLDF